MKFKDVLNSNYSNVELNAVYYCFNQSLKSNFNICTLNLIWITKPQHILLKINTIYHHARDRFSIVNQERYRVSSHGHSSTICHPHLNVVWDIFLQRKYTIGYDRCCIHHIPNKTWLTQCQSKITWEIKKRPVIFDPQIDTWSSCWIV